MHDATAPPQGPPDLLRQIDVLRDSEQGIAKLRGLILDLAVRGKLVPQDPLDTPASVTLIEIASEQARLVKEGRIRKPKSMNQAKPEALPYAPPAGWAWTRLTNLGEVQPRNEARDESEVSFLPMSSISDGYSAEITPETRTWSEVRKGFTHVADGDVVLAKITPCFQNRKSAVIRGLTNGIGAATTELHVLRPIGDHISPEYILIFLKSEAFIRGGVARMTGSAGQKRVPRGYFAETPVPIPPRAEQERIVDSVGSLLVLCDQLETSLERERESRITATRSCLVSMASARDKAELRSCWQRVSDYFEVLFDVPETTRDLQQAILTLGIQGKLVRHDPTHEPATILLESTEQKRRELSSKGRGQRSTRVRDRSLPETPLPAGWIWVNFGDITFNRDGERVPVRRTDREQQEKIYDYYGASGVIDKVDSYLFDEPLLLVGEDGANLINRATPIAFIAEGKYWVNNHAHVVGAFSRTVLEYLCLHINAISLEPYITGMAQPKMNQARMNSIPIALPPHAEQAKIVNVVNSLQTLCVHTSSRALERRVAANRVLDAILGQVGD